MKAKCRRPVSRAAAWLLTLGLAVSVLLLGGRAANAQGQPLRVILGDFTNTATHSINDSLAINATAAVYNELVNAGQGRFDVIPNKEVRTEAVHLLGIRPPLNETTPIQYTHTDLIHLARQLGAEAIIQGEVASSAVRRNGVPKVALQVTVTDVSSGQTINGGSIVQAPEVRPGETALSDDLIDRALEAAAQVVVQQMVSRQVVTATILQINGSTVILNRGARDGMHVGDDLVIIREGANGLKTMVGSVHLGAVYATDSEATIVSNTLGIRPEDYGRVIYRAPLIITPDGGTKLNTARTSFNFSTLGTTLTALGLGVLISAGAKGGQASVTNVIAEATIYQNVSAVKITWNDNIWGQGGVQQYHIWRNPDFPFTPFVGTSSSNSSSSSSSSSSTTGSTTSSTSITGLPVGAVPGSTHIFYDRAQPYEFYQNGYTLIFGSGDGGIGSTVWGGGTTNNSTSNTGTTNSSSSNSSSSSSSSSGTTSNACSSPITYTLPGFVTGFLPGTEYSYSVSAMVARQILTGSGGTSGSGTTGTTGTTSSSSSSSNSNTNNGNSSAFSCIETDPVTSGNVTPLNPVIVTAPVPTQASQQVTVIDPLAVNFTSVLGADQYEVEISMDPTFSSAATIYRIGPIYSPTSQSNNTIVVDPNAFNLNLVTVPQLLANKTFAAWVAKTTTTPPQIYLRVGARQSTDGPGPVAWIGKNPSNPDKTWRWVYTSAVGFTPLPTVPGTPGGNLRVAQELSKLGGSNAVLPLPGSGQASVSRLAGQSSISSIASIIGNPQRRRH